MMATATTFGRSARLFPRSVEIGDEVLVRRSQNGGYFTDAGTVSRGKLNRQWVPVVAVRPRGQWYTIDCTLGDSTIDVGGAANSKLIVRKPVDPQ